MNGAVDPEAEPCDLDPREGLPPALLSKSRVKALDFDLPKPFRKFRTARDGDILPRAANLAGPPEPDSPGFQAESTSNVILITMNRWLFSPMQASAYVLVRSRNKQEAKHPDREICLPSFEATSLEMPPTSKNHLSNLVSSLVLCPTTAKRAEFFYNNMGAFGAEGIPWQDFKLSGSFRALIELATSPESRHTTSPVSVRLGRRVQQFIYSCYRCS